MIVLGWPVDNTPVTLTAFTPEILGKQVPKVKSISILGYKGKVSFTMDKEGLHFTTPNQKIDDKNFVIKINTKP